MPALFIDIEARFAQFTDALDKVSAKSQGAAKNIQSAFSGISSQVTSITSKIPILSGMIGAAIAGMSVAKLESEITSAIHAMAELERAAEKTGASVENLSALKGVAKIGGTDFGEVELGLTRLAKALAGADEEARGAGHALAELHLDPAQLRAGDTADAMLLLAEALAKYQDGAGKTAIIQDILGKSGAQLLPYLKDLADTGRLVGKVTKEQAEEAKEYERNLKKLTAGFDSWKRAMANDILPSLVAITDEMVRARKEYGLFGSILAGAGALATRPFGYELDDLKRADQKSAEIFNKRLEARKKLSSLDTNPNSLSNFFGFGEAEKAKLKDEIAGYDKQLTSLNSYKLKLARAKHGETEIDRPKIDHTSRDAKETAGKGARAAGEDTAKAALANDLKDLERLIRSEEELVSSRNKVLDEYYGADLISISEFFERRNQVRSSALQAEIADYDAEAARLQQYLKTATGKDRLDAEAKLQDVIAKRAKAEQDAADSTTADWFRQQKAIEGYEAKLIDLQARLLELRGETTQAAVLRFDVQQREFRQRLTTESTSESNTPEQRQRAADALESLDAERAMIEAQTQSNELREKAALIQQNLATAEKRLEVEREAGAVGELEMLGQVGTARAQSAEQLEKIADELRAIAILSDNPKLIADAEAFKAEVDKLAGSADLLGQKFKTVFEDAFANSFASVVDGTKSVSEAFRDMANNIVREISRIAAQNIADQLFKGFGTGSPSGGGGGGGGGAGSLGMLGGFISGLFGGGSGGGYSAATSSSVIDEVSKYFLASAKGNAFGPSAPIAFARGGAFTNQVVVTPTLFRFAHGGQMRTGLMGEAGPEAVMPLSPTPSGRLGVLVAGGGALPVTRDGGGRLAVELAHGGPATPPSLPAGNVVPFARGGLFQRSLQAATTAARARALTAGGLRPTGTDGGVTVHMTINTPDAGSFLRSEAQISAAAARAIARGKRNL